VPRLLAFWAKQDPSFDIWDREAYRGDLPTAEVHVLDARIFALDAAADEMAKLVRRFMN
jgi:hypothetical protein